MTWSTFGQRRSELLGPSSRREISHSTTRGHSRGANTRCRAARGGARRARRSRCSSCAWSPARFLGREKGARHFERRRLGSSEGPMEGLGMGERNVNQARGAKTNARVVRLGKRVVDVDAEIEAELAGRPPLVQGKAPGVPHRSLLEAGDLSGETDEMADVRWRLLDDAGDSRGDPSDSDAPRWGDGSGDAVTQFLVATDGARGAFEAVAAAVEAHGGGVAGVIPGVVRRDGRPRGGGGGARPARDALGGCAGAGGRRDGRAGHRGRGGEDESRRGRTRVTGGFRSVAVRVGWRRRRLERLSASAAGRAARAG